MKKLRFLFILTAINLMISSCDISICDCIDLHRNHTFIGGDYFGLKRTPQQRDRDINFMDCAKKFGAKKEILRRSSECD